MPIWMQIQLDDEVIHKLGDLAREHRRSKRMELLHAVDFYVEREWPKLRKEQEDAQLPAETT